MHRVDIKGYGSVLVESNDTFEMLGKQAPETLFVAAKKNGMLRELSTKIGNSTEVELVGIDTADGAKIYQRSLIFLLIRSALEVIPTARIKVSNSLSKGVYCTINNGVINVTHEECKKIKDTMRDYVNRNVPILPTDFTKEAAETIFRSQKMDSKAEILRYRNQKNIRLYELDKIYDYFYGYMVPSTGYLQQFDLRKYGEGVILSHPTHFSPDQIPAFEETPKMAKMFEETDEWLRILDMSYVYNLNEQIRDERHIELTMVAEALQEKKIAEIADEITKGNKKVILIAGPSSSGKTTFANRLKIQLKVNGLRPITIGTDDYFVDREFTPRDENGDYDFESLEAVDVERFGEDINKLLDGEEIEVRKFDFTEGKQYTTGEMLHIDSDQPIIIEGIHGLNDKLTAGVFKRDKYKIYISALTQLNIDEHNRIPTSQARMIRRIVRDNTFRGHSAKKTISMWHSVRRGEEKYIFPFQEQADAIFNSALPYELAVLKKHALPLLMSIKKGEPEYQQARLLIKFLEYFESYDDDSLIPDNSILKEFIGGSVFA